MKFLLFGAGKLACQIMDGIISIHRNIGIDIIAFIDNDESKYGEDFYGKTILHPGQIADLEYDYICILAERYEDVYNQLVYGYHVESTKLVDRLFLLKHIMTEKYRDNDDPDIQATISYWKNNHELSFLNQFQFAPAQYDKVFWDAESNMPYIIYKERRLYYPRSYRNFIVRDNSLYVISYREMEQHEFSPHRYLVGEINIRENDVVVDAGAMEGDFALPFIEIIKKLYIFESNLEWVEALKMTYKEYKDKVVIVPKMLSDMVNKKTTTLQESVKEDRVDFIKMDIEGAEVKALASSQDLLQRNNLRCAICCYHKKNDREEIEAILKRNGYQCSVSNGYTVFVADPYIMQEADFRKGVVYAKKEE